VDGFMYIYMYIYTCVYIYIYVCLYLYMYIHTCASGGNPGVCMVVCESGMECVVECVRERRSESCHTCV